MLTVFVSKKDLNKIYVTTPDKYSKVLQELGFEPTDVWFTNISLETIMLILDGVTDYITL